MKRLFTCSAMLLAMTGIANADFTGAYDHALWSLHPVGCHLLKAVEGWNDMGFGRFQLAYLRDRGKREVDFVVIRDGRPWFLAEVKHRDESMSGGLGHFQKQLKAPFAFHVVVDADYVDADCFAQPRGPVVVPAKTLLSQLP